MQETSIHLTEHKCEVLHEIARITGKSEAELIEAAVDQLIAKFGKKGDRSLLRKGRGLWKDRDDLPDFGELRGEFDRF